LENIALKKRAARLGWFANLGKAERLFSRWWKICLESVGKDGWLVGGGLNGEQHRAVTAS